MKIRHEINILTGTLAATSTSYVTASELFFVDASKFSGTLTGYLKVVYTNTSTGTANAALVSGLGVTLAGSVTTFTEIETTPAAFSLGSEQFRVRLNTANAGTVTIKSASFVIIQDTSTSDLSSSECQFEIGNRETAKVNTTAAALTAPKYWKYNAGNWDGAIAFYAEITWTLTGTGTGTVRLQESSADLLTWTDKVTIVSAGTAATATRVRSIAFTPTDGRMYRIVTLNSSSMGALGIYNAKIIVQQSLPYVNLDTSGGFQAVGTTSLQQVSQAFVYGSGTLSTVVLGSVIKTGSPTDNLFLEVQDSLGGTVLATSSTVAGTSLTTTATNTTFTFSTPPTLVSGTTYYLVVKRSGALDSTNRYGINMAIYFAGYGFDNNQYRVYDGSSWNTTSGVNLSSTLSISAPNVITKLEEQYLLANTTLAAGTALQKFLTKWDSAEWDGVDNTYIHTLDQPFTDTSVVEIDEAAGTLVSGSTAGTLDSAVPASASATSFNPTSGSIKSRGQTINGNGRSLTRLAFNMSKLGSPVGFVSAKLYATSGGLPTGSPLATSTNSFQVSNLTTTGQTVTFFFDPIVLTSSVVYAVGLAIDSFTTWDVATNTVNIFSTATAHSGQAWSQSFSGTFSAVAGDIMFDAFTNPSPTFSMPANGDLDVKATTNSGSVYASRIIARIVKTVTATSTARSFTVTC